MNTVKLMIMKDQVVFYSQTRRDFVVISKDHTNYNEIYRYLLTTDINDFDEELLMEFISQDGIDSILAFSDNLIEKKNEEFILDGKVVPSFIAEKIKEMKRDGYSFDHFLKFWKRCLANPNPESVDRLFTFLENQKLSITKDGCFLAYKGTNDDYTDIYTGTFDNTPGNLVSIPREEVDPDAGVGCSKGLHVGSFEYARGYASGRTLVLCRIDPADVVSVPTDCNCQKIRCCQYVVLSRYELKQEHDTGVFTEDGVRIAPDVSPVASALGDGTEDRSGLPWESWEDRILIAEANKFGGTWENVSKKVCRSADACRRRYDRLNN